MGQFVHQIGGERVPHPAGVVVEQHGHAGHALGDGLEVEKELLIGGLEKHGLEHADTGGSVGRRHFGKAAALFGADGTDTEVHRHPARGLSHHDFQAPLHLVLFHHVELAVAAEGQHTGHTAVDDVVHLIPEHGLINALLPVDRREDRHNDALNKISVHRRSPHIWSKLTGTRCR